MPGVPPAFFVSIGGGNGGALCKARYEADRANVPVRLLDLDGLVKLYVDSYDNADAETRSLLPLTRIWWPA